MNELIKSNLNPAFDKLMQKMTSIEQNLNNLNSKFANLDKRIIQMDSNIENIIQRIDTITNNLSDTSSDKKFDKYDICNNVYRTMEDLIKI